MGPQRVAHPSGPAIQPRAPVVVTVTEMKPEKRNRPGQQEEQAANADDVCSQGHGHDQEGNADSYYCANVVTAKVARESFGRGSGASLHLERIPSSESSVTRSSSSPGSSDPELCCPPSAINLHYGWLAR
jgi:hypothetical protein